MLAMEHQQPLSVTVTYAEVRAWACWLGMFTASDLAMAMAVDQRVAENGIKAMLFHGICEEIGEKIPGAYGDEPLIRHKPLPPGPKEHVTLPPEWRTCAQDLVPAGRGMPIRLSSAARENRRARSTPGVRHRILLREKRYQEMEEAKEARRVKNQTKAKQEPKWKRSRDGAVVTVVE